jgi:hypothetical protein
MIARGYSENASKKIPSLNTGSFKLEFEAVKLGFAGKS